MLKRYTAGTHHNRQDVLDILHLIEKAQEAAQGFVGCNSFHLKLVAFLNHFGTQEALFDKVYFHVRSAEAGWKNSRNDDEFENPHLSEISDINESADVVQVSESERLRNLLLTAGLVAPHQNAISFQFFGFCDYLIVLDGDKPSGKALYSLMRFVMVCKKQYAEQQLLLNSASQNASLQSAMRETERDLRASERSLKKRVYEIHNLLEVSSELYSILNLNQLINSALLIIVGQMACQKAFAFLYDSNKRRFSRRFTKGLGQIELEDLSVELDHPLISHFSHHQKPILTQDLKKNEPLFTVCNLLEENNIDVVAPIMYSDRIHGIVGCGAALNKNKLVKDDLDIFSILINMISISLANAINYEEMKNLSLTDPMTGLNNYRYFEDRLHEEINRAKRNKTTVSLLMLDIDHFKNYNDTLGHQAGDEALRTLGWLLRNAVREEDIVSRYGGEEFCIILPGSEKEVIDILGERIRVRVEEYPFYKETVQPEGRVTVSIGGATFPNDADDFDELIHKADLSLYKSKNEGRNQVTVFS